MQRQKIFEVIKPNIIKVLPGIHPYKLTIDKNHKNLAANSCARLFFD